MRARLASLSLGEPTVPFDVAQAVVLDQAAQLAALRPAIRRVLARDYGVQGLADRLCPVERADGSISILARAEHVGGDQADALVRHIRASGRHLSEPARYVLPAALLLAVSREPRSVVLAASPDRTPGALAGVFQDLVDWGVRHGASDLHLNVHRDSAESEVRYTVAGRYVAPERFKAMPTALLMEVLAVAWMDIQGGNGAVFDPLLEQQGSLVRQVDGESYTLRWASLAADRGASVCLRFLARHTESPWPDLTALGYRDDQVACFERVMCSEGGAIVLAGTVGSGKSTTLATLIQRLPDHRKVITLEEPVEYRIGRAVQNTLARDLHAQAHEAYGAKLRTLKRSAMSDVLLGEIRDRESGLAFMDLVGSGLSLYTTVHAPSARAIVDRLASPFIGVPRDFLTTPGTLKLLVYQALLPRLCAACALSLDEARAVFVRRPGWDAERWARWVRGLEHDLALPLPQVRLRNAAGCRHCRQPHLAALAGYRGRTVAAELLEPGLCDAFAVRGTDYLPDSHHSAFAHALQMTGRGWVDPRDVEARFMAFETWCLRRRRLAQTPAMFPAAERGL